jgi:hypothetical protein
VWLQKDGKTPHNPYMGKKMPKCGERQQRFAPRGEAAKKAASEQPSAAEKAPKPTAELPPARELAPALDAYADLRKALFAEQTEQAQKAARAAKKAVAEVRKKLKGKAGAQPAAGRLSGLEKKLEEIAKADKVAAQRKSLAEAVSALTAVLKQFGVPPGTTVRRFHCPMAFDGRGADWLQKPKKARNPYMGEKMPRCGSLKETLTSDGSASEESNND